MRATRRTFKMLFGDGEVYKRIILKQIAEWIQLTQHHGGLNAIETSGFVKSCHRPLEVLLPHCNGTYPNFPFQRFGWTGKVRSAVQHYECVRSSQVLRSIILFIDITCAVTFFTIQYTSVPGATYFQSSRELLFCYQNLSLLCNFTLSLSRVTPPIPFPIVTVSTTKGLAERFKILGS